MHTIKTLAACVMLAGCVSPGCIEDCYITEQQQYESRLNALCDRHTFDRRCEGRSPSAFAL